MIRDFTGRAKDEHKAPGVIAALEEASNGKKLSRQFKNHWTEMCREHKGVYRLMGWEYNFRTAMKKFVVKTDYCLSEVYAFDEISARDVLAKRMSGKFHYAVEVPRKEEN